VVAHGHEIAWISIASCFLFGGLQDAMKAFEDSVADFGFKPVQDEFFFFNESVGDLFKWSRARI
jgi:hypothetical protein